MSSSHCSVCGSAGRASLSLLAVLVSFVLFFGPTTALLDQALPQFPLIPRPGPETPSQRDNVLEFKLRHVFHRATAGSKHPDLHLRRDVRGNAIILESLPENKTFSRIKSLRARANPMSMYRLANRDHAYVEDIMAFGRETGHTVSLANSDWNVDEIMGPNVTDKETVLSLARIAANAYVAHNDSSEWIPVGPGFEYNDDFGWEEDGLRGHIFIDAANSTVIIGTKGTSLSLFDGSGPSRRDKENDNLLFSCCCGEGESFMYHHVCQCKAPEAYTCNSTCLTDALRKKAFYYHAAADIYKNVTALYPNSDIWLVGHSLGGAISSLVGLTYGNPAVTFEAPGEAMAAKRLHLPTPPDYHLGSVSDGPEPPFRGVYHFGHTADPIFMGQCSGAPCSAAGYAMQSVCHTGMECVYDTMTDLNWGMHLINHRIVTVVNSVIPVYNETAKCEAVVNCTADCFNWKYFESNGTETTTTSSVASSTSTCQTPGWFGCLDETTTTTTSSSSSSSSTSSTMVTSTTTCETPGWFGCKDPKTTSTSTTATPAPTITSAPSSTAASTTDCETPGLFWGCKDQTHPITTAPTPLR